VSKSYNQILGEVGDAVDYLNAGGVAPDLVAGDLDFYAALAELPDDAEVDHYAPELPDFGPSVVSVESVEEFELVYLALGAVHGFPVDRYKITYEIDHERDHLLATSRIGFKAMRYGLMVTDSNPPYSYGWRPLHAYAEPTATVTKLAIGSQVSAPRRLSDGDQTRLGAMKYNGQQDVAHRIIAATDSRLSSLRLPTGFALANS
jgi:hypothetical protein